MTSSLESIRVFWKDNEPWGIVLKGNHGGCTKYHLYTLRGFKESDYEEELVPEIKPT